MRVSYRVAIVTGLVSVALGCTPQQVVDFIKSIDPSVRYSDLLSKVAMRHVAEVVQHDGQLALITSQWFDKQDDHQHCLLPGVCLSEKPMELMGYPGGGQEFFTDRYDSCEAALYSLLNDNTFKSELININWNDVGGYYHNGQVVVWLGKREPNLVDFKLPPPTTTNRDNYQLQLLGNNFDQSLYPTPDNSDTEQLLKSLGSYSNDDASSNPNYDYSMLGRPGHNVIPDLTISPEATNLLSHQGGTNNLLNNPPDSIKKINNFPGAQMQTGAQPITFNEPTEVSNKPSVMPVTPVKNDVVNNAPTKPEAVKEIPTNSGVVDDIPANPEVVKDDPVNHDVVKDTSDNSDVVKGAPDNPDAAKDVPVNSDVAKDTPDNSDAVKDIPAKSDVTKDVPTKSDTKAVSTKPNKTTVTSDKPDVIAAAPSKPDVVAAPSEAATLSAPPSKPDVVPTSPEKPPQAPVTPNEPFKLSDLTSEKFGPYANHPAFLDAIRQHPDFFKKLSEGATPDSIKAESNSNNPALLHAMRQHPDFFKKLSEGATSDSIKAGSNNNPGVVYSHASSLSYSVSTQSSSSSDDDVKFLTPIKYTPTPGGHPKAAPSKLDIKELYKLINSERGRIKLPPVAVSPALEKVASAKCENMKRYFNFDHPNYSLHDWAGPLQCTYNQDHNCMNLKPQQLAQYPDKGFEISFFDPSPLTLADAVSHWLKSANHRRVILQEGPFAQHHWHAMGGCLLEHAAHIWFGDKPDQVTGHP